jgi:hypothetical protein
MPKRRYFTPTAELAKLAGNRVFPGSSKQTKMARRCPALRGAHLFGSAVHSGACVGVGSVAERHAAAPHIS